MRGRKCRQGRDTILARAAVHLERILVGENVDLDTSEVASERSNRALSAPVVWAVLSAVDEPGIIVTNTAEAAIVLDLGRRVVRTKLLRRRPKVVDRVFLVGENGAIGNEDVVYTDTLARVWKVESVIIGSGSLGVGEGVQVPVSLLNQLLSSIVG